MKNAPTPTHRSFVRIPSPPSSLPCCLYYLYSTTTTTDKCRCWSPLISISATNWLALEQDTPVAGRTHSMCDQKRGATIAKQDPRTGGGGVLLVFFCVLLGSTTPEEHQKPEEPIRRRTHQPPRRTARWRLGNQRTKAEPHRETQFCRCVPGSAEHKTTCL